MAIENAELVGQLRELQEALVAQRELAALGAAIANLQHRISNDISVVGLNVPRLRSRVDPSDVTITGILDMIERNTCHVSEIMGRINRALQESEIQTVDINGVLNEVVGRVQEKWNDEQPSSPVVIIAKLDNANPQTRAPIGQLTEVFYNLLDNAYRVMMKKGGDLVVSSCLSEATICVRVQDTGPGIPLPIQKRLFKRPVPSKEPGGGTGMGLWLNSLVLQSIGGSAIIESTGSTGTTMLVQIPALAGREEVQL